MKRLKKISKMIIIQDALDLKFQSKYKFGPGLTVANRLYYVFMVPENTEIFLTFKKSVGGSMYLYKK